MNALKVDPESGFLVAPNVNGFTAEKKMQFLELAKQYRADGKFPSVSAICAAIGINFSTFERHLQQDEHFQAIWQEITSHVEYECISDMHDLRKKNPMYMFGLLRYLNPKRWHPDNKLQVSVDYRAISSIADKAQALDAEVSPAVAPKIDTPPSTSTDH